MLIWQYCTSLHKPNIFLKTNPSLIKQLEVGLYRDGQIYSVLNSSLPFSIEVHGALNASIYNLSFTCHKVLNCHKVLKIDILNKTLFLNLYLEATSSSYSCKSISRCQNKHFNYFLGRTLVMCQ